MKYRVLHRAFFGRPALAVAKELLGKFLVRRYRGKNIGVMITEIEAYIGPHDKACHASRGRTKRTEVMFGEAGRFYIYFTYGMHWLLNIVTGPKNYPAAVLIRGALTEDGEHVNGPAKLTKYLKIDKKLNDLPAGKKIGLWIEDHGVKVESSQIKRKKRIGVGYAKDWASKPYNFKIERL